MKERITCTRCNDTGITPASIRVDGISWVNMRPVPCPICSLLTLQQRLELAREEILRNQRARAVERQKELN